MAPTVHGIIYASLSPHLPAGSSQVSLQPGPSPTLLPAERLPRVVPLSLQTAHASPDSSNFPPPARYSPSCVVHKAGKMWFVSLASMSLCFFRMHPRPSLSLWSTELHGSPRIRSDSISTAIMIGSRVSVHRSWSNQRESRTPTQVPGPKLLFISIEFDPGRMQLREVPAAIW